MKSNKFFSALSLLDIFSMYTIHLNLIREIKISHNIYM